MAAQCHYAGLSRSPTRLAQCRLVIVGVFLNCMCSRCSARQRHVRDLPLCHIVPSRRCASVVKRARPTWARFGVVQHAMPSSRLCSMPVPVPAGTLSTGLTRRAQQAANMVISQFCRRCASVARAASAADLARIDVLQDVMQSSCLCSMAAQRQPARHQSSGIHSHFLLQVYHITAS